MSIPTLLFWLAAFFFILMFLTGLCFALPKPVSIPLCLSALCAFCGSFLKSNLNKERE